MSSLTPPDRSSQVLLPVKVTHHATTTNLRALIDSGADESLMAWGLAAKLELKSEPLVTLVQARAPYGKELFTITHTTEPLEVHIHGHTELRNFFSHHLRLWFSVILGCADTTLT